MGKSSESWEKPLQLAFVDESGNTDLDTSKEGASTFFVVGAALVSAAQEEETRRRCCEVRKKHFGPGEMKSKNVGNKHSRRLRILQSLDQVPFKAIAVAVDKRELSKTGGFIYKKSFLKFLNGLLYSKLYRAFPSLDVFADEHGSREFMDGFRAYVHRNHIPGLFDHAGFLFRDSQSDELIQLADFIAGTVNKIADPSTPAEVSSFLFDALRPKMILLEEWPPKLSRYLVAEEKGDSADDRLVAKHAVRAAIGFVNEHHAAKAEPVIRQRTVLSYLLFKYRYEDANGHISTGELRSHLENMLGEEISEHTFRSGVIAPLRDGGVLIASSSKGYKIPSSVGDIVAFIDQYHGIVRPMVRRLKAAREAILLASSGRVDVLSDDKYEYLRHAIEFKT